MSGQCPVTPMAPRRPVREMKQTDSRVFVVAGALPPPVTGKTAVTAIVCDRLRAVGIELGVINIAAVDLGRSLRTRLRRLLRVIGGLHALSRMRRLRGGCLYLSISGGGGQVYEIAFLILARSFGMLPILHHHSFAYLDSRSRLASVLVRVAGRSAIHVTQSLRMAERLNELYHAERVHAVSNAVFLVNGKTLSPLLRSELRMVGFISNITVEKGIFEFLELMAAAKTKNLPIKGKIAGPFQSPTLERVVSRHLATLENVEYVGPKYGADKEAFFAEIDTLVFPTSYANETEGIVNHEAMRHGIPVIAYGRGAIPEIVDNSCGLVVAPDAPFVSLSLAQIECWLSFPALFQAASEAAAARFVATIAANQQRWIKLLHEMIMIYRGGEDEPNVQTGSRSC